MLGAAFVIAAAAAYLQFGLLPGDAARWASDRIRQATGTQVRFDRAIWLPFRGLTFSGLKVWDSKGRPLFIADAATVDFRLRPLLFEKKLEIANATLESPVFEATIDPRDPAIPAPPVPKTKISGQIEIPAIPNDPKVNLSALEDAPNALLPENVYLEQVSIADGRVTVRRFPGGPVIDVIRSIDLRMRFVEPPVVAIDGHFEFGGEVAAATRRPSRVTLKGNWNLDRTDWNFATQVRLAEVPEWLVAWQKNNFLVLSRGAAELSAHVRNDGDDAMGFAIDGELENAEILQGKSVYSGRMAIDATGRFDFPRRRFDPYRGTLYFVDVNVDRLSEKIERLQNLSGKFSFEPDTILFQAIQGQYRDLPFGAEGSLRSFKDLNLHLEIHSDSSPERLLALVPEEQKTAIEGYVIEGRCRSTTLVEGSLRDPSALSVNHRLELEDGRVRNPERGLDLEAVSGELRLEPDTIRISKAKFRTHGQAYGLDAVIPKKSGDEGRFALKSDAFSTDAAFAWDGKRVRLRNGRFAAYGISATFDGILSNLRRPHLDVKGRLQADLEAVSRAFEKQAPGLASWKLRGVTAGPFLLKGPWNDPGLWNLQADLSSDRVEAKELELPNFQAQVRMEDRILRLPYVRAEPYGGIVGLTAALDLSRKPTGFEGRLYANTVQLEPLARGLGWQKKDSIKGTLIFQTTLAGAWGQPETYVGQGSIDVRKGALWRTDLFKAMGNLPFVKVLGLDEAVFKEMNGTFAIRQKRVWTNDLSIRGDSVDLGLSGSGGFAQDLDLAMNIQYSDAIIKGAFDTGGIVPFVVTQAEGLISTYHVGGTLKDPKFEKHFVAPQKTLGRGLAGVVQAVTQ